MPNEKPACPKPDKLDLIQPDNWWEVIEVDGRVMFAMEPDTYQLFAINMTRILRYVRQSSDYIRICTN